MMLGIHSNAVEQRQPRNAERSVFCHHDILTQLHSGTTACKNRQAVIQRMTRSDIAAVERPPTPGLRREGSRGEEKGISC